MTIRYRNLCFKTIQKKISLLFQKDQESYLLNTIPDFSKKLVNLQSTSLVYLRMLPNFRNFKFFLMIIALSSLVQNVRSHQVRQTATRVFTFLEKYHYPVVEDTCNSYSETQMIQDFKNNNNTIFYERYIIFQAVKEVIGNDAQVNFKCVENYESDNSDDPQDQYAGKFGSEKKFYLETQDHYQSIPSLFYEKLYIQKQNIIDVASFSVFKYLNYLFYLGIFLIPAVTGASLLLFKDLNTFYDYQRVVYSVFRYMNRQGDQQMSLWLHKILSLFVALFFFFYYSILLSEMTAKRRQSISLSQINIDIFRDIQNYPFNFSIDEPSYSLLYVDLFQYLYLLNDYEINNSFQDQSTYHYNVQFSKNYFTQDEISQLNLKILSFSARGGVQSNVFAIKNQFTYKSDDIYLNWLILAGGVLAGLIFKCLQLKFSFLNQYTEIQGYREQVNQNIAQDFGELFRFRVSQLLSRVQAKDHYQNFKQIPITQKCYSLGKQVFKVIVKRRKKKVLHKTRKQIKNLVSTGNEKKQKPNLYQVIKEFLAAEKKMVQNNSQLSSTSQRRYAMQAALFTQNEEQRESQKLIQSKEELYQSQFQIRNKKISNSKNTQKDKLTGSFNAVFNKNQNQDINTNKTEKKSAKSKPNDGRKDLNRRLTNLAFSQIHVDSPKVDMKSINSNLQVIKIANSKSSSPKSDDNNKMKMMQKQFIQQFDITQQDGSNRNRRRGTNHVLSNQQLQSIKVYDDQLHKKFHRRHSSYIKIPPPEQKNYEEQNQNEQQEYEDNNSNEEHENYDNEPIHLHFNLEVNQPQKSLQIIRSSDTIQETNQNQNKIKTDHTLNSQLYINGGNNAENNVTNDNKFNMISPQSKETERIGINQQLSSANDQYYSNGMYHSNRSNQTELEALYPKRINLFDGMNNYMQEYQHTPQNGENSNFNKEYLFTEDELIAENSQHFQENSQQKFDKEVDRINQNFKKSKLKNQIQ
ncbi:transmembrane protein, putative (macronuclear) [Tetrahymena thermophila SB210]|uniref:Transmembrane protein, putative n=1 Tax=Tetrahymena thermophila (strain SB210) TaxID=312017 RepID=I7M8N0_TETTS|nr:transmembrane protein, putative [Tetrahymena thermophila SB210]EAR98486.2 transmembrane protein, putative [Tetrahymena thermophila SB210]|eukprot:XP_001018731.2 transmembrane protein, putative [Tetrahymena thermophila SB210]